MLRVRDAVIAVAAALIGGSVVAVVQAQPNLIGPSVYDWTKMSATATPHGTHRQVMRGPTKALAELEVHVTTLNPGLSSHAPHTHENEELVIIREGTVEVLNDGAWKRLGPGSIIFNASNSPHALRNVGSNPAVYDVVNWTPPKR
ncbi:cupin domain-containing protein [Phenylobacterium deserti]|uniref:Cupin domain-containing protein n=1 Tax=Phenylobacterium deserti TaxID=1914756 RepID=A0A328AUB9_9CAUL|nr:cupin domain-containing protein [Phenylobacterium deserti]RAK58189.1 cupin domain-containing protein [Phenylobacterium deserti]